MDYVTKEEFDRLLKRVEALEGKVKRKTKLPESFSPTKEHQDYTFVNRIPLYAEIEAFRLHHEAKGTLSANWNSSFSTWLRNAVKFRRSTFADQKKEDADRVLGRSKIIQVQNGSIT